MYLKLTEGNFFIELDLGIVYNQNIILGYFDYDIFMFFFLNSCFN